MKDLLKAVVISMKHYNSYTKIHYLLEKPKNVARGFTRSNSLLVNSSSLVLSTGLSALFGLIFWTVVAHSYKSQTVGLSTTLLSMSILLSLFGLMGFDTIFIRFLPKSKRRNDQINTGLIIAGSATAVIAGFFCLLIPLLAPKLLFVDHNIFSVIGFITFTIFTAWNSLTSAILIAYRKASLILIISILFSAFKMCLPFIIHSGGPMTIFAFTGFAQIVNVSISMAILIKYFGYRPTFRVNVDQLRTLRRYGLSVYVAHILDLLPNSALPLIVVNKLGATAAAYFYIAFTIASLLYTIVYTTAQTILSEASNNEGSLLQQVRKGILIISSLMLPATIVVIVLSPYVLSIFGHSYRSGAISILRILCLGSIGIMFYALLGTIFKTTHKLAAIITTNAANAIAILVLSLLLSKPWGLNGIGWAWLIGCWISVLVGLPFAFQIFTKKPVSITPKSMQVTASD